MRRKLSLSARFGYLPSVQGVLLLGLLSGGACDTPTEPLKEYTIAGRVTEAASPSVGIPGVLVSINRSGPNYDFVHGLTDSSGAYSLTIVGCTVGSTLAYFSKDPEWEFQRHIIQCDVGEFNVQMEPSTSSVSEP